MKKQKNSEILDMTRGPFFKKIIFFALPLIFTGLLQLLYNSADTIVVGRFAGKEALAAVGATGSLVNLILNIFIGLSMGSGVMEARHIGAGDEKGMSRCTHTAMTLSVLCGIVVAAIGYFCSGTFLKWMDAPDDVLPLSTIYLQIYFLGAPGSLVYNFGASLLRAMGDTKRPLYILFATGLVNVALNLILVIPFGMSVKGVAIATITAQYISAVCIVLCLMKLQNPCRLSLRSLRIYKRELLGIIKIGLPAGLQNSLFSISNVIIQTSVNSFGSVAMAGIAAGSNYDGYIFTCTNAITQTAMNFSSQNVGAVKYENIAKIYRRCLIITIAISAVMSCVGFFLREQIVWIFSKEPDVIAIGAQRLALIMPFYAFCSLQDMTTGQVRGMGYSVEPMIISVFGACGLRLLWIFVALPHNPTLINLYWAYPISWSVTFVAQLVMYFVAKRSLMKRKQAA